MVPHLFHFIWLTGENSRPFSYFNYMAIKCVKDFHSQAPVIIHCNEPPKDNIWWNKAAEIAVVMPVTVPKKIGDTEIKHIQYASDVIRLSILHKWGGMYLDTDMLIVKPMSIFRDKPLTMAIESVHEDGTPKSVANGVIFARPQSEFLSIMLDATPIAMKSDVWANHAVTLPLELSKLYPDMVNLEHKNVFFPFDLSKNWLFDTDYKGDIPDETHAIHIYETFWRDTMVDITPEWLEKNDCLFKRLFLRET